MIDVNVPKHVTNEHVCFLVVSFYGLCLFLQVNGKYEDEDENRPTATEELAGYLWDNYIECVFSTLMLKKGS